MNKKIDLTDNNTYLRMFHSILNEFENIDCFIESLNNDSNMFMRLMNISNYLDQDNILENKTSLNILNNIYNKQSKQIKRYGVNYKKILEMAVSHFGIVNNKNTNEFNGDDKKEFSPFKNIKNIIWIGSKKLEAFAFFKKEHICNFTFINADKLKIENYEESKSDIKITLSSDETTDESESSDIKKLIITNKDKNNTIIIIRQGITNMSVIELSELLQKNDFYIINNPINASYCSNKEKTIYLLEKYNIAQPKYSVIDLSLCNKEFDITPYIKNIYGKEKYNDENTKYVIKMLNTHGGTGVFICNGKNILSILQTMYVLYKNKNNLNNQKVIIQEYHETERGDYRINVLTLNGKQKVPYCILKEKLPNDFRTNLSLGSTSSEVDFENMPDDFKKTVLMAAAASGCAWCGVDCMIDKNDGKLYIIELNATPGSTVNVTSDDLASLNIDFYYNILKNIDDLL